MSDLRRKNRNAALGVFGIVLCMTALAFASVPLYNLFCRITGYGGTTQVAQAAPDTVSERIITVRLNAETASSLPWEFAPEQRRVDVHPGQKALISYKAVNLAGAPVTGTAVYNVSPPKAGKYFKKIECFCFGEQLLEAGQEVAMPVLFFIDPKIDEDPGMKDVTTITLSYTFFKIDSPELERALEDFYNQPASGAPAKKDAS